MNNKHKIHICNIYPVDNQDMYKQENYVMILAHLADEYKPENFTNAKYIILDNGLFEKKQVSTSVSKLVEIALKLESKGIKVNEIIVPDKLFDGEATIELYKKNKSWIEKYSDKFHFMFVLQAKDMDDLIKTYNYIEKQDSNIVIGVPKLAKYDRYSTGIINMLAGSKHPIHFLGLKNNFEELKCVSHFVRSCDSSQISYLAQGLDVDGINLVKVSAINRNESKGLIDLATVNLSNDKLNLIRDKLIKEAKDYVIL